MAALWSRDGAGWHLLAPGGFPDEATLHSLVEEAPDLLPLAGSPRLLITGREVALGNGYADLIAVEPSGRVAVIEVKLAKNAEARRAIVAQVLTYAAYLKGLSPETFEETLAPHLRKRGYTTLADVLTANDQEGAYDAATFTHGLKESLEGGRFRLVLVLDSVPAELARLVNYLESVTDGLVIDLIAVTSYAVNGSQIVVPQRIEGEPQKDIQPRDTTEISNSNGVKGWLAQGAEDFAKAIATAPAENQPLLRQLYEWAVSLEKEDLVTLATNHGKTGLTLLPRLKVGSVGLVTIWDYKGGYLQFWRSVFERRAPKSLSRVEELAAPIKVGAGNGTYSPTPQLLAALTDAYREAANGRISLSDG